MIVSVASALPPLARAVIQFSFADSALDVVTSSSAVEQALASGFVRLKANDVTPLVLGETLTLMVGLGDAKDFTPTILKRAAGTAVRYLRDRKTVSAAVFASVAGIDEIVAVSLIAQGAVLGAYDPGERKSTEQPAAFESLAIVSTAQGAADAAERASVVADAANLARQLVDAPSAELTPAELAAKAVKWSSDVGLEARSLTQDEISSLGMVGVLAVGQGSRNPSSFTVIQHMPNPGQAPIVLVGKGVCFDSGGINLKSGADLHHMKDDMAGAACVVGALVAVAKLKLPVNVVGLIPAAENMPGGNAFRPSDVLKYANGKTVEIVNTDAEGRLVLADALIYGEREFHPTAMVDLATLTGSCVVALGEDVAGVFSANDALANSLVAAGEAATEPAWRLPLYKAYRSKFDSGVADMTNAGDRWGGSITAALFLAEFVEKTPWAHIDVAGPVYDDTEKAWLARGATGYGVALLVEYLTSQV